MSYKEDMERGNLVRWITDEANGKPIEAIVIGHFGNGYYPDPEESRPVGVVLSWEDAKPHLNYNFHDGFGGAECHAVYAWTADKVIFVSEYDGSTRINSVPRHPVVCEPRMA